MPWSKRCGMPELPLEQVEELVEESVFHPSPCKRHREQVLKSAVQATVRQKVSHRMIAAGSASVLVMGILLIRAVVMSRPAVSENTPAASATSVEATAAAPATPAAAPQHAGSSGSLGEELY